MNRDEFLRDYWSYYLMLEKKFISTFNYVELDPNNYSTYSNEYASLIQTIGAELDSFFKIYCGFQPHERKTITDYANCILTTECNIINTEILASHKRLSLIPFSTWNQSQAAQSLDWWKAFDHIKHSRTANYSDASLKNTLYLLCALYILESKYLVRITNVAVEADIPDEESSLFSFKIPITQVISNKKAFLFPS